MRDGSLALQPIPQAVPSLLRQGPALLYSALVVAHHLRAVAGDDADRDRVDATLQQFADHRDAEAVRVNVLNASALAKRIEHSLESALAELQHRSRPVALRRQQSPRMPARRDGAG